MNGKHFFQCSFLKRLQILYDNEVGVGTGGNIDGIDEIGGVGSVYMLVKLVVFYKNEYIKWTIMLHED